MTNKQIMEIVKEEMPALADRKSLKRQWSDSNDFIEVSVWSIEAVIKKAYELGKADGKRSLKDKSKVTK